MKDGLLFAAAALGVGAAVTVYLHLLRRWWCLLTNGHARWIGGWIGVPAHELSHAAMCILFGHKVEAISFFQPENRSGVLGYVNHAWNPHSLYQRLGCFFIGIAPLVVNMGLAWFLLNHMPDRYDSWQNIAIGACVVFVAASLVIHAAPSPQDLIGASHGVFVLLGVVALGGLFFPDITLDIGRQVSVFLYGFIPWVLEITLPFFVIVVCLSAVKYAANRE